MGGRRRMLVNVAHECPHDQVAHAFLLVSGQHRDIDDLEETAAVADYPANSDRDAVAMSDDAKETAASLAAEGVLSVRRERMPMDSKQAGEPG